MVCNPKGPVETTWSKVADLEVYELERFLAVVEGSENIEAVLDDASLLRRVDPERLSKFAVTCATHGNRLYLIGHLATSVPKMARDTCDQLWCFNQPGLDANELARNWGEPELKEATHLQRYEVMWVAAGRPGVVRFVAPAPR